jgi:CheY-like chemotaxis protein
MLRVHGWDGNLWSRRVHGIPTVEAYTAGLINRLPYSRRNWPKQRVIAGCACNDQGYKVGECCQRCLSEFYLMSVRILVVDDSPLNLALASYVLGSVGYVVEEAVDADDVSKLLKQTTPDLILMDIGLPGMDGLTLTRQLKADKRLKNVPIVALTASAIRGNEQKALLAGCAGYITKPIDVKQFSQQVAAFLHQAAATTI